MTKPHLAMIHGLLGAIECLRSLEKMIGGADAWTIQLIGYGENRDANTQGITLAAQAAHAALCIEEFGWRRTWVLGHSVGGAVAKLLANQRPDLVKSVIDVEGNFTLKDAFWSGRIAKMSAVEWDAEFRSMQADPAAWLERNEITPNAQRLAWTSSMLQREQPASTIHAMAQAVVAATSPPSYLDMIHRVADRTPIHLFAGERSAAGWDVPEWMRAKAKSYTVQPSAGHMMMLEDPEQFSRLIDSIIGSG